MSWVDLRVEDGRLQNIAGVPERSTAPAVNRMGDIRGAAELHRLPNSSDSYLGSVHHHILHLLLPVAEAAADSEGFDSAKGTGPERIGENACVRRRAIVD